MSNQQALSGMEIRILAEKIVRQNQGSDTGLQAAIEGVLSNYILLPKYSPIPTPTSN
jgi:hypothetical protein